MELQEIKVKFGADIFKKLQYYKKNLCENYYQVIIINFMNQINRYNNICDLI
jgi:hypothetical protein